MSSNAERWRISREDPGRRAPIRTQRKFGRLSRWRGAELFAADPQLPARASVKAHLTRVFQQIGVTDRTQAALWARDNLV